MIVNSNDSNHVLLRPAPGLRRRERVRQLDYVPP